MHRARKRFGQNFLVDTGIISEIIDLIDPQPGQRLVEIGPGHGALTRLLLARGAHLDVLELDRDLVQELHQTCAGQSNLAIHAGDALKFDFKELVQDSSAKLRILGNLPYNISTPLIFHVLEYAHMIEDMHFMLQQEVVDRIAAGPGSRQYGRLSVMVQARCSVEVLLSVPPGAFRPVPKVDSAVFRLVPRFYPGVHADMLPALQRVVSQAFSQRRKLVRNNLKKQVNQDAFDKAKVAEKARPEELSIDQYICLAGELIAD